MCCTMIKKMKELFFAPKIKCHLKSYFLFSLPVFFFHLKKSILKDFLSLLLRPCGPSCLGKRGSGHKTMYEIIVQVPAFGPRNNYAPSGSPVTCWDWKAKVSSAGEDTQHCLDQSGHIGDGWGWEAQQQYCNKVLAGFSSNGHFSSAGQVENTATGVTLGKVKEILKGLWVEGNWYFTEVSSSMGPNDRKKP